MAQLVQAAPLGELRAASSAGGGTALSTTAVRIVLPMGTRFIQLIPRNFSTAVVAKVNLNPWLTILKTTDLLATKAALTNYSEEAQDGASTAVTLSSLDTLANGDAVYIGSHVPFSGLAVTAGSANGNAATLAVTYWNGSSWADISPTDGTASGGATFAQTGNITWTVPTAWASARLKDAVSGSNRNLGILNQELFWVRLAVSAALDSSTTATAILAINRDTTYAELAANLPHEQSVNVGPGGISSITALTDAGTANLIVNVGTAGRF